MGWLPPHNPGGKPASLLTHCGLNGLELVRKFLREKSNSQAECRTGLAATTRMVEWTTPAIKEWVHRVLPALGGPQESTPEDPAWLRAGVVPEAVLDAAIVLGPGSEDAHSQRHT